MPISNNISSKMLQKNAFPTILVVEDNPTAQKMTKHLFEPLGFQIDVASNGEKGVALFEPGKYVLIIMDIELPDFDGYEVTKRIRQIEKDSGFYALIIGVSAYAPNDQRLSSEAGFNQMLAKPLLLEAVKELLQQHGIPYNT